ncbi:UNVERIFIED_CONTAM: hypothetical protein Slati_0857800 [Sesamum latifolium]|uniref:Uncharacterized protein n=1 Tax=Sesamum latifolium TaxID=2727402 RepID=A0AAW2XSB9_9LAMI
MEHYVRLYPVYKSVSSEPDIEAVLIIASTIVFPPLTSLSRANSSELTQPLVAPPHK